MKGVGVHFFWCLWKRIFQLLFVVFTHWHWETLSKKREGVKRNQPEIHSLNSQRKLCYMPLTTNFHQTRFLHSSVLFVSQNFVFFIFIFFFFLHFSCFGKCFKGNPNKLCNSTTWISVKVCQWALIYTFTIWLV